MEASIAIGSMLEGTVLLWVYDPSQIDIKYHIKSNINLLLQGLRTEPTLAIHTRLINCLIHSSWSCEYEIS
jgi:hypothetical protein